MPNPMYFDYLMLALCTLYNCKLQCLGTQGTFTVITALKLQIAIVYKMVIFGAVNVPSKFKSNGTTFTETSS